MSAPAFAAIWRGLVVSAIVTGSLYFALADLSGLPLAAYDDTLLHFAAFAAMTLLAATAFPQAPLIHLLLALGLLSGITELLQFAPGVKRQPDWTDFAFNVLGIDCALILVALMRQVQLRATGAPSAAQISGPL